MTSKAEDKVEIVVQVESKDTSSKVILIMLIIVLFGLVIAVMMRGGPDALLSSDDDRGVGNCGDGIDMTKEVKPTVMIQIVMQTQKFGRAMTLVVQRQTEITTLPVGDPEVKR